jgi:endonuclease/exonuclease/phosphatase family metal-dependent hydrolase
MSKALKHLTAILLLLTLCLSALAGCAGGGEGEETTATPEAKLTIDSTYRIVISAEADEITKKAADLFSSTLKEKAGLELPTVTDAEEPAEHEIVLGYTNRAYSTAVLYTYNVFFGDEALHVSASDSNRLYFAVEAVLDTWLTADFGLAEAGHVVLAESRLADLNGLALRLDNSIKIMTQNVRGSGEDGPGLSTLNRLDRFVLMLEDLQPDIMGTQEFSYTYSRRLTKEFAERGEALPYAIEECSVDGVGKKGGGWNAIIYRTDRFERLDGGTFWLSNTPDISSGFVTNHKRVCTWLLLKDKQTDKTFVAANTHLDHTSNDIRVKQISILMEELPKRVGDYPIYLTGDFNCGRGSDPYNVVAGTFTDAREGAWVDASTMRGTFHGYRDQAFSEIDFVFHSEHSLPIRYEIISKKYENFVSDHYGVMVEFVME